MKISSQNSISDVVSAGVNTADSAKRGTLPVQDFKSYMNQQPAQRNQTSSNVVKASEKEQPVKADRAETAKKPEEAEAPEKTEPSDAAKPVEDTRASGDSDSEQGADTISKDAEAAAKQDVPEAQPEDTGLYDNIVFEELAWMIQPDVTLKVTPEQLMQLVQDIQTQVESLFGMDSAEFNNLLAQLDMQCVDLLNSNSRKEFLLAAMDAQPVDLLTNEELSQLFARFTEVVEETVEASDIPLEAILPALEQMDTESRQPDMNSEAPKENAPKTIKGETTALDNQPKVNTAQSDGDPRLVVETDSQTRQGYHGASEHANDLNAMKDQVIAQLGQKLGQVAQLEESPEPVTPAEIVRQVVEEIKLVAKQDTTSMELQLYPQHLGKVTVQVSTRNGMVTAQITAENEMARAALEGSIQTLKETFQNQEIKVEAIEVMVATSSFSEQQFENQQADQKDGRTGNNRHINLDDLEMEDELSEEEQLNVEMMRQEGRSVDYTA